MRTINKVICVVTMAIMLFSTMGIGAFAEVDDNSTVEPATATEESTEAQDSEAEQEQQVLPDEEITEANLGEEETQQERIALKADVGNGEVTLSWDASEDKIYDVIKDGVSVKAEDESIAGPTYKVSGLENGTKYTFKIVTIEENDEDVECSNEVAVIPNSGIKLQTFSGYFSVHLEWNRIEGANKYEITRKSSDGTTKIYPLVAATENAVQTFKDTSDKRLDGKTGLNWNKKYSYSVRPIYDEEGIVSGLKSNVASDQCVKPMYYRITFNQTKTLTSHDGTKTKTRFKKGTRVDAHAFNAGCYKFYYKNHLYHVNKSRTYKTGSKKRTCVYSSTANYSTKEAEYFVNDFCKAPTAGSNWLLWTSFQCQHVYAFNWDKTAKKWVYSKYKGLGWNWECSTGKANSPSPCGINYYVQKKLKSRHNISYWTCWQSWNAYHGKLKSWRVGKPASGGCFRNDVANANKIYKYVPKRTRVIAY